VQPMTKNLQLTDNNLLQQGLVLHQQGELGQAHTLYLKILERNPKHHDAWQLLGLLAYQVGEYESALELMRNSLAILETQPAVYANLGLVYSALKDDAQAEKAYRRVLELDSQHLQAICNYASLLVKQNRLFEVQTLLNQGLMHFPNDAELCHIQAQLYCEQSHYSQALTCVKKSLQIRPNDYATLVTNGNILKKLGQSQQSLQSYQMALKVNPNSPQCYNNLAQILTEMGHVRESIACYRKAVQLPSDIQPIYHSNLLHSLNFDTSHSPEQLFAEHCEFGRRYCNVKQLPTCPRTNMPRKLRIGYVSPDIRKHPTVRFLEPVLQHHNRNQFEIYLYAEVAQPDEVTHRLSSYVDGVRFTVGQTDLQVAQQIHRDEIDILIDCAGHTAGNRLLAFAHKPAHVQASWLGYGNTTGIPQMDYFLSDAVLDPVESEPYYLEKIVRLPRGVATFLPPKEAPEVAPLPYAQNGRITFGSLHRPDKLNDGVFELWASVLKSVPHSQLLIFWPTMHGQLASFVRNSLLKFGLQPQQLLIEHQAPSLGYLDVYNRIDIGLDVFPWTGGTTTSEALWMGVPIIGLRGKNHAGRGTARILTFAGMPELIAETPEQYLQLTQQLAESPERIAAYRYTLRRRLRHTLCDAVSFTRTFEETLVSLFRR